MTDPSLLSVLLRPDILAVLAGTALLAGAAGALAVDVRARRARRSLERRMQTLLDCLPYGVQEIDRTGTIVHANDALHRILGREPGSLIGAKCWEIAGDPQARDANRELFRWICTERPVPRPYSGSTLTPDGRRLEITVDWTYRVDARGRLDGFTSVMTDITDKRRSDEALRLAKETAEQANSAKTRFLASASHDLRQPLQATGLYLSVLRDKMTEVADDPETAEVFSGIETSLDALGALLNSLLDVSKLDAGIIEPDITEFPVQSVLSRMSQQMRPVVEDRGLVLKVVASSAVIRSDRTLIEQMLRNLLANAVRYTDRGGIVLGCRRRGGQLAIQVADTGIGIPNDRIPLIFEEFYQIGNVERDRSKGVGLGLAIVDRLSRLLNHPVRVSSELNRGTIFEVLVPMVRQSRLHWLPAKSVVHHEHSQGVVVLIEDDPTVRKALAATVRRWDYTVCDVADASEADTALRRLGQRPALILADYRLRAGQTGVGAIADLRQAFGPTIPAIVLTGDTSPERLAEVQAQGLRLLVKPVDPDDLAEAVAEEAAREVEEVHLV